MAFGPANMRRPFSKSKLLLPSLVLMAILLALFIIVGRDLRDWADSDSWVTVQTADFTIQPKTSLVQYRYTINSQTYESERTHFFVSATFQDPRHLAWLNSHRQATEITVYYDPDAPQRAVLVPEITSIWELQLPLALLMACVIILLPILFFGFLWRWLRRQFP